MAAQILPFPRLASNDNWTDPNPPQPGLRSFIVYDEIPGGCIAFEATDNGQSPHLRRGDFAIVDADDRDLTHGDLYLIEWRDGGRQIIEARTQNLRIHPRDGSAPRQEDCWFAAVRASVSDLFGRRSEPIRWHDGPYNEAHFRAKLVGRVIGILEADFRAELRRAA